MIYSLVRLIFLGLLRLLLRWEVTGKENVPVTGSIIMAANHASVIDPILMVCATSRRVSFMAKEELFRIPILGWIFPKLGAFPVRRGRVDRSAIQRALELLRNGGILGLFPEGTRSADGMIQTLHSGVAMFAMKTGASIVPVGIVGSDKVLGRGRWVPRLKKVKVHIGTPICVQESGSDTRVTKPELEALTIKVMSSISELMGK